MPKAKHERYCPECLSKRVPQADGCFIKRECLDCGFVGMTKIFGKIIEDKAALRSEKHMKVKMLVCGRVANHIMDSDDLTWQRLYWVIIKEFLDNGYSVKEITNYCDVSFVTINKLKHKFGNNEYWRYERNRRRISEKTVS